MPNQTHRTDPLASEIAKRELVGRFQAIIDGSGHGLWSWQVGGDHIWTSPRLRELLGFPPAGDGSPAHTPSPNAPGADAPGVIFSCLVTRIHPSDSRRANAAFAKLLQESAPFDVEFRVQTVHAGYRWFRAHAAAQRDASGKPLQVAGSLMDIHDYKTDEAREAARARTLTLIAKGTPLPEILRTIVEQMESENPGILCSVLLLDKSGTRLMNGAAPSLPDFYNQAIDGIGIGPEVGTCGTAAWFGKRIFTENIQTDPKWAKFKDLAARAGLGSCLSEPVLGGDGRVLGTFAIYKSRPGALLPAELDNLTAAGQFAAVAIEHKYAEDSLRWRTAFFEAQADSSTDGLLVIDSDGRKVHQNQRMVDLWKIPPEFAENKDDTAQLKYVISRVKNPAQFAEKVLYLYDHPLETSRDEVELVDGTILERFSSPVFGKAREYYGRIWRFRDITEQKAMEEKLRAAAQRDGLTSLPNRAMLLDRLQYVVERHKRHKELNYAVLFIDFDRFKNVNDSLGHSVGDQLLREIASRLQKVVRPTDVVGHDIEHTVSRLGGDEFVILLDLLQKTGDAIHVAQRILDSLSQPFSLAGHDIVSTASVGIVTSEFNYQRAEDILRDADTAMYEAKTGGKARAALFDQTMRTRLQRKLELEDGLRKGSDSGQFVLHFQPIVSLQTGRIDGVESLLRWQHPQHGMISPSEFIPIAEEAHLIVPLGEWAFRQACASLSSWWKSLGHDAVPSISVNLSRAQLCVPALAQQMADICREEGVDPAAVHLEITESAIMGQSEHAAPALRRIKAVGFKLDMDDFGTGYSSLASLQQLPIDVLKIDRSFIANLSRGQTYCAMVSAIVTLANNLKIAVVAEGVETKDQLGMLQSLGCPRAQGFLIARPMPADELAAFVAGFSNQKFAGLSAA
jgi:diguanylate cyclase (GGDEF)-like protein